MWLFSSRTLILCWTNCLQTTECSHYHWSEVLTWSWATDPKWRSVNVCPVVRATSVWAKINVYLCNKIHAKRKNWIIFNDLFMSSKCSNGSETVKKLLGKQKSWLKINNLFFLFISVTGAAGHNVFRICHDYVTSPSGREPLCNVWRKEALWKQGNHKNSEDHLHKAFSL